MTLFRNTLYTEHAPDSPNERFGAGSTSQTRTFDLVNGSFQSRMQAAYDFLGYAQVLSSGNANEPFYIHRVLPMPAPSLGTASYKLPDAADVALLGAAVPDMGATLWAFAISRTEPLGSPQGVDLNATPLGTAAAKYLRARLSVEFSTLPYQVKPDLLVLDANLIPNEGAVLASQGWPYTRYITRQIEPFARVLQIPFGVQFARFPDGSSCQSKVGIPWREGGANVSYTWMRVPLTGGAAPGVNYARIGTLLGTINSAQFDQFAAQTLLFDNFKSREYQGAFGERLADVTFNFIFMPHPSTGALFNGGDPKRPMAGVPQGWNSIVNVFQDKTDYFPVSSSGATPDAGNPPFTLDSATGLTFADLFRP